MLAVLLTLTQKVELDIHGLMDLDRGGFQLDLDRGVSRFSPLNPTTGIGYVL